MGPLAPFQELDACKSAVGRSPPQNKAGFWWTVEEVRERLKAIITAAFGTACDLMVLHDIDMQMAAFVHPLSRIGGVNASQGTRDFFAA